MGKKPEIRMYKILPYHKATGKLSLREKVGQLFMPAAFINDTEEEVRQLEGLIRKARIGGLCFFHSRASAATNFEGRREVIYNEQSLNRLKALIKRYQAVSEIPLLISMDAEWGLAMRVENTPQYPYAITLGAIRGQDVLIEQVGRQIAQDCLHSGIHWNFAPVADINLNPDNPVIGYRSFGGNREEVARKATALMKGMQAEGLLTCAKHFPGHGDTATDSHLGLPVLEKDRAALLAGELYPFSELIREGVDAVMVGHLAVPALTSAKKVAASISPGLIGGLLRQGLGFRGAVVSDALNMHSVSKLFPGPGRLEWEAFHAGNDILCFAEHPEEGLATIQKKGSPSQIETAFQRVWGLKEKAFARRAPHTHSREEYESLLAELATASLTLLSGRENDLAAFRTAKPTAWEVTHTPGGEFGKQLLKQGAISKILSMPPGARPATDHSGEKQKVVIALYPPSVKPPNNFGISEGVLSWLNRMLHTAEVALYNFGNPYVLQLLDVQKARAVIQVYQDFPVFQRHAARQFLGLATAEGSLPVTLKINKS